MPLWKAILAYDGTAYNGWQVQPGLPTVQGTLAQAIHHVTGQSVLPQGSGRTDTGVHALAQVASFPLDVPIPPANLHRALNRALPPSIRVLAVEPAPQGFHARHSATGKSYQYRIFPARPNLSPTDSLLSSEAPAICSPMLAPYVWDCPLPLDLAALETAAAAVLGTHDFTSFAATDPDLTARTIPPQSSVTQLRDSPIVATVGLAHTTSAPANLQDGPYSQDENFLDQPQHASNIRTIQHSHWQLREGLLIYTVTGTGFLHHMVRNLVGTFAEIGCGRLPADAIPRILAARNRSAAGPTAPARGLFLVEVFYPPTPPPAELES